MIEIYDCERPMCMSKMGELIVKGWAMSDLVTVTARNWAALLARAEAENAELRARLRAAEDVCQAVEDAFGGGEEGHWVFDLSFPETRDLVTAWDAWRTSQETKGAK